MVRPNIEKKIGIFKSETENNKDINYELNIVSWGENPPKYEIRRWDKNHYAVPTDRPKSGFTLSKKEAKTLFSLLQGEFCSTDFCEARNSKLVSLEELAEKFNINSPIEKRDFFKEYYDVNRKEFKVQNPGAFCVDDDEELEIYGHGEGMPDITKKGDSAEDALRQRMLCRAISIVQYINQILDRKTYLYPNIWLEFSNDIKYNTTSNKRSKSICEIKREIGELLDIFRENDKSGLWVIVEELEELMRCLPDKNEYFIDKETSYKMRNLLGSINEKLNSYDNGEYNNNYRQDNKREQYIEIVKKIVDMLDGYPISYIVLGEYDSDNNTIILYLKAICQEWESKYAEYIGGGVNDPNIVSCLFQVPERMKVSELLIAVFTHELFHAYHHKELEINGKKMEYSTYKQKVVVESLAASAEFFFASEKLENLFYISDMKETWERFGVNYWPYSGAKFIVGEKDSIGQYDKKIMKKVYKKSLDSMETAYIEIIAK